MYELGKDFTLCRDNGNFITYRGLHQCIRHLRLGLQGEYQLDNGALALAAVEVLRQKGFVIKDSSLRRGLKSVSWPGRLETVGRSPLIILDGAHNPAAIKKLTQAILDLFHYKRLLLIIGIMGDKNIRAMIHEIVPIADRIIFCKPHMDRAASTATLASLVKGTQAIHTEIENVAQALFQALSEARPRDLICITGSLFTVGEAKEALGRISNTTQPPPMPPGDAQEIPLVW
jgi:dihydrofolate synthase/folylpolyglutamate synthase